MTRIHLQQKAKVSQTSIRSMEQDEPEVNIATDNIMYKQEYHGLKGCVHIFFAL